MPEEITYPTPTVAPDPPTAQQVYSAPNITQTVTAPVARPNLSDAFGLYDQFMNTAEIQEANARVNELQNAINAERQGLRTTTTGLEYQNDQARGTTGASMNLIGRQVGRASQLASDRLSALGENLNAALAYRDTLKTDAQNRYNIAQNERAQIQDLIRSTKGKAGISYTDSFESAMKKVDKYEKELADEEYKKSLKATAMQLGISTKNKKGGSLKTKDLEKAIAKFYGDKAATDKLLQDLEIESKRIANSTARSGGGGTVGERQGAALANAQDALLASRGTDGKVDPNVYTQQKSSYLKSGGSSTEFDNAFAGLLSEQEQGRLGISTVGTRAENKPATQYQYTAANYGSRLQQSGSIINNLENNIAKMSGTSYATQNALVGKPLVNSFTSSQFQVFDQAKRDFINAVLRRESGAVISQDEFRNAEKQYFPLPGDSLEVIEQKRQNRELVTQNFINEAGNALQWDNDPLGINSDPLGLGF